MEQLSIPITGERISISCRGETGTRPRRNRQGPCGNKSGISRSRFIGSYGEHLLHGGTLHRHQVRCARAENREQLQSFHVSRSMKIKGHNILNVKD